MFSVDKSKSSGAVTEVHDTVFQAENIDQRQHMEDSVTVYGHHQMQNGRVSPAPDANNNAQSPQRRQRKRKPQGEMNVKASTLAEKIDGFRGQQTLDQLLEYIEGPKTDKTQIPKGGSVSGKERKSGKSKRNESGSKSEGEEPQNTNNLSSSTGEFESSVEDQEVEVLLDDQVTTGSGSTLTLRKIPSEPPVGSFEEEDRMRFIHAASTPTPIEEKEVFGEFIDASEELYIDADSGIMEPAAKDELEFITVSSRKQKRPKQKRVNCDFERSATPPPTDSMSDCGYRRTRRRSVDWTDYNYTQFRGTIGSVQKKTMSVTSAESTTDQSSSYTAELRSPRPAKSELMDAPGAVILGKLSYADKAKQRPNASNPRPHSPSFTESTSSERQSRQTNRETRSAHASPAGSPSRQTGSMASASNTAAASSPNLKISADPVLRNRRVFANPPKGIIEGDDDSPPLPSQTTIAEPLPNFTAPVAGKSYAAAAHASAEKRPTAIVKPLSHEQDRLQGGADFVPADEHFNLVAESEGNLMKSAMICEVAAGSANKVPLIIATEGGEGGGQQSSREAVSCLTATTTNIALTASVASAVSVAQYRSQNSVAQASASVRKLKGGELAMATPAVSSVVGIIPVSLKQPVLCASAAVINPVHLTKNNPETEKNSDVNDTSSQITVEFLDPNMQSPGSVGLGLAFGGFGDDEVTSSASSSARPSGIDQSNAGSANPDLNKGHYEQSVPQKLKKKDQADKLPNAQAQPPPPPESPKSKSPKSKKGKKSPTPSWASSDVASASSLSSSTISSSNQPSQLAASALPTSKHEPNEKQVSKLATFMTTCKRYFSFF